MRKYEIEFITLLIPSLQEPTQKIKITPSGIFYKII